MQPKTMLAGVLGATLIVPALPAKAQDVEEIIVTARKREESLLRVPVVATAITQEALEKSQINDLYAVSSRVPGFVIGESVGTVGIQASLRGIGPTSQTATVDQSVSLNIDGLALTQGYAYAAGMFDVGQVEVLKGPQALFYGKNSTAGVISLRSADPTDERQLLARGGFETEADEWLGELVLSGPVAEHLKMRLAGRWSEQDGYFRNSGAPLTGGLGNLPPKYHDFAPKQTKILRGTALLDGFERYDARLKMTYVDDHMDGNGGDGQLVYCPDGTGGVEPFNIPFIYDADCKLDRYTQLADFDPVYWPGIRNDGVPFMDSQQLFGSLEQNFHLSPELTLTSVTGYYHLDQDNLIRGSGSSNPTIAADFTFENEQFTQELRLASDYDDRPVDFMLGAFYQDGQIDVRNRLRANTFYGLPPLLQSGLHKVGIESISAFGQLIWQATDTIELAGGVRWTREERTHDEWNALADWAKVDLLVPKIEAKNTSPELSLTWTPTDTLTLFASYRQGFKSGSFNTIVYIDENTRADFGDEKAEGGELGLKSRLLDRQLSLNLASYYYRYSDLQVGANDLSETGGIVLRTINAASAEVYGAEMDMTFYPRAIPMLSLHGGLNYNHARYDHFGNAPCGNGQTIAEGCDQLYNEATGRYTSQDLSGRALVRAPTWSGNAGFDYSVPIGDLTLSFGSTTVFSSNYYVNLVALPGYKQDAYYKLNANIALKGRDDRWEVALIGNNLNDEIIASLCSNSNTQNGTIFGGLIAGAETKGPAGSDELGCVGERGREMWMRLTLRL